MLLLLNSRLVNNINCICIEQNSNIQLWVSTFQGCMTLVTVEHLIQTVDTSNFVLQIVFHLQLHLVVKNGTNIGGLSLVLNKAWKLGSPTWQLPLYRSESSNIRLVVGRSRRFQPGEGPSRGFSVIVKTGCGTDGPLHSSSPAVTHYNIPTWPRLQARNGWGLPQNSNFISILDLFHSISV